MCDKVLQTSEHLKISLIDIKQDLSMLVEHLSKLVPFQRHLLVCYTSSTGNLMQKRSFVLSSRSSHSTTSLSWREKKRKKKVASEQSACSMSMKREIKGTRAESRITDTG